MKRIHFNKESHQNRRGIAVLWLVLWGSLFLTFFCVVLEITTLWQAQVEINNALDSAALSAVKEWGASGLGATQVPRDVGIAYTAGNPVLGVPTTITSNFNGANLPNENNSCNGNLIFGGLNTLVSPITFDASADVTLPGGIPAVRAQATVPVQGFCSTLFGFSFLNVSASSTAYFNTATGRVALVRITTFVCP
ncbi:TadE/TadG family type IV pilus assembly protein [Gimesia aquarii]|uniref:Uncharacterized protein n=1 Tax=Gimesia aquarii TaxID=2527964 RepID=A0A517X1U4_9PLAN|nr:hypothetical protein [Gimesia aquarii]QDU11468.1 hypothetical protein V202x_48900 [Gimesia aquarii]